ncbi:hypothetical protein PoB_000016800 [Plakobranchus ocellatus]|uniref:Transmembrane protein n=1 Tax=Plakobranchus ocellatus TaxID=259542 RepID=A0AAV3XT72_9GAST|nr:hypothetical protein PoB_000016800 [Plakobranchus ocellatus]
MRRAVDDVNPTPRAHRLIALLAVFLIMAGACICVDSTSPPGIIPSSARPEVENSSSGESIGFDTEQDPEEIIFELRILYVCDATSKDFCRRPNRSHTHTNSKTNRSRHNTETHTNSKTNRSRHNTEAHRDHLDLARAKSFFMSSLPRGCMNMKPASATNSTNAMHHWNSSKKDAKHAAFSSLNSGKTNRPLNFGDDSEESSILDNVQSLYDRCWRLEDGGLHVERSLPHISGGTLRAHVTSYVVSGTFADRLRSLDVHLEINNADIIVAVGDTLTVQTAAIVGEGREFPVLGYITEYPEGRKPGTSPYALNNFLKQVLVHKDV